MNLIIKDRCMGKTAQLIHISEATKYPIVVPFAVRKKHIIELANQMGCSIVEPLTMCEVQARGVRLNIPILFDDIECILADALQQYLGAEVFCATMTDTLKDYYKSNQATTKEQDV